MSGLAIPEHGSAVPVLEGLLLTGDGLQDMHGERLQTLREVLGGFGLQVTVMTGAAELQTDQESSPMPVGQIDFKDHAKEVGASDRLAAVSWSMVRWTCEFQKQEDLPKIRELEKAGVYDLRSIKERLVASRFETGAWRNGTRQKVYFVRSLVEARLGLGE